MVIVRLLEIELLGLEDLKLSPVLLSVLPEDILLHVHVHVPAVPHACLATCHMVDCAPLYPRTYYCLEIGIAYCSRRNSRIRCVPIVLMNITDSLTGTDFRK